MLYHPASRHFLLLRCTYYPQHPVLKRIVKTIQVKPPCFLWSYLIFRPREWEYINLNWLFRPVFVWMNETLERLSTAVLTVRENLHSTLGSCQWAMSGRSWWCSWWAAQEVGGRLRDISTPYPFGMRFCSSPSKWMNLRRKSRIHWGRERERVQKGGSANLARPHAVT